MGDANDGERVDEEEHALMTMARTLALRCGLWRMKINYILNRWMEIMEIMESSLDAFRNS